MPRTIDISRSRVTPHPHDKPILGDPAQMRTPRRAFLAGASAWALTTGLAGSGRAQDGAVQTEAAPAQPQAPPGASPRNQELIQQLRLDIPPGIAVSHSISYRLATREDADSRRLDVYRNESVRRAPVLVFFHGGAWRSGHRRQYIPLGVSLALGGVVCVIPSYSLAPKYPFPEPLKDAAAALVWVRDNIQQLGGNPNRIFVAGHSSGAHIAAQVALDRRYLDFHFQPPDMLRGVIGISGIYAIGKGFEYAFGTDPAYWAEASPVHCVHSGAPPFLLAVGENEPPAIAQQTVAFAKLLQAFEVPVQQEVYPGEDHSSMIALASLRDSRLQQRIRAFVKEQG